MLLDPPVASEGFQLNVPKFDVAAGDEVQNCYFFAVPGTPGQDVWVNHFKLAANDGTHHMNVFRVKTIVDLGGKPGDVVVEQERHGPVLQVVELGRLAARRQHAGRRQTIDWTLPDGVGQKFSGRRAAHAADPLRQRDHADRRRRAAAAPRTSTR